MPLGVARGRVEVEWNAFHQAWDIDSGPPNYIHTTAGTREAALSTARRLKRDDQTVYVKGPKMSRFKKA